MKDKKFFTHLLIIILSGLVVIEGLTVVIQNTSNSKANQETDIVEEKLPENGINNYGRLSVSGNHIVDENGNEVLLKGMSTHGITWFPRYANSAAMNTIREYGGNVIRLALYSENVSQDEDYWDDVRDYAYLTIENALANDMYIIVDWHVLSDENPLVNKDKAMEILDEISSHYGNEPGIIYEICNEPNGDTSWQDIKEYANEIIPLIRGNAKDAIIIVGTPNYSTALKDAFDDKLEWTNLLYAYHVYVDATTDTSFDFSYIEQIVESGMPVFVSEWGIKNTELPDEKLNAKSSWEFLNYLNENKIGWCYWSLSNKDETHSSIKSDCEKYSGWKYEDMTFGGRIAFEALGKE